MEFTTSIEIAAPSGRVWDVMIDVEHWHEWTPSIVEIRRLDQGPMHVGSRARIRQPKALPAVWRVIQLDPGRSFSWFAKMPGAWATADHVIEPTREGARVTLSVRYGGWFGGVVGRLLRDTTTRYLALEAQGLKRRSET